jgi:putative oxidoreductase
MKFSRLLLRLVVGGLFIGHGAQKLFGWFGGHGIDATGQFFEQLGMRPGRRNAIAAGVAEAGGGAALVLGFATPVAGAALTATMLTAISRVHAKNGPWASDGGFEYNLVLIAAALSLVDIGPGKLSVDAALGEEKSGPGWALAAGAAGVAGAVGAHLLAQQAAAEAPQESGPAPAQESAAATPQESAAATLQESPAPVPSPAP